MLAQVGTAIAQDTGDPLLTAAILHWNAHHVPWTEAWWQFPIFTPTADTLAFSEHLLGISVIATPLAWVTGNPLAAYNLTLLLTFPLSGIAMYALVFRLARSVPGAFVAGLAFAFAPYRISTVSHIQSLAAWWAPLALLGLHAYLDRGTANAGRWRWLALFGAAWMLQGASNGYALVFFTLFIGFWVLWFVVLPRRWNDLAAIAATAAVASLPLIPILYKYTVVHARHGFARSLDEVRIFSADLAAVACAPANLSVWGWIRVACRGEGELFPGVAIAALAAIAWMLVLRSSRPAPAVRWTTRALAAVSAVYAVLAVIRIAAGPITLGFGLVQVSITSVHKPLLVAAAGGVAALLVSLAARARATQAALAFYLCAAAVAWLFALGPEVIVLGVQSGREGPFALLTALPGASSLRVPARFWLMSMMSLAVVAGLCVAHLARIRRIGGAVTALTCLAVLADGWTGGIPARIPPPPVPDAAALRERRVMTLPIEPYADIAATWHAVTGGWSAVNGYSGNAPRYYTALASAAMLEDEAAFAAFRADADLHVVVPADAAALTAFVRRQPGATLQASDRAATQVLLPRRQPLSDTAPGAPIDGWTAGSPCSPEELPLLRDGDPRTQWACPAGAVPAEITIDAGRVQRIGGVGYGLGGYHWEYATHMAVETSLDGTSWSLARSGSILADVVRAGMREPLTMPVLLAFEPRDARYVRLRPIAQPPDFRWSIAELGVWSGPSR